MRSPFWIVPGLIAFVGRRVDKWKYFSLPFSSLMLRVSGSSALSLDTVGLSPSVALNVFEPIVIFILPSAASLVTWALPDGRDQLNQGLVQFANGVFAFEFDLIERLSETIVFLRR